MESNPKPQMQLENKKHDVLNFAEDPDILRQLQDPTKEGVIMSCKVAKWNKYSWQQDRNFVVTNTNMYNFNKKKLRRIIAIDILKGMTKNLQAKSNEFVLHVENEPDYRVTCEYRQEFMDSLKIAYITLTKKNLKIFGIGKSKSLADYVTTEKDVQRGNNRMPLNVARLYEEDLMSEEQLEQPDRGIFNQSQDDLVQNIDYRKQAMTRRKSSVRGDGGGERNAQMSESQKIYTRNKMPHEEDDISVYEFEDFKIIRLIGRGNFGKVYLVQNAKNKKFFAMKSIRKDVVIEHDSLESLKVEKLILLQVNHPFIISMDHVYANETRIYFIMQFVQGGELFKHLSEQKRFSEERVKFYAAQIALALGYLHQSKIYYRDLKPENILLSLDGYILLADFGLAKINQQEDGSEPNSFCGTPEYISPEMIVGSGHDHTLDWWALGVLIYEMIIGIPPFYHKNQNQMYLLIQQAPLRWPDPVRHGIHVSEEAKDLINRLLMKDRRQRLGQKADAEEILSHAFFQGLDLNALQQKQIKPEFLPTLDQTGLNNFDQDILSEAQREESMVPLDAKQKIKDNEDNFKEFGLSAPQEQNHDLIKQSSSMLSNMSDVEMKQQ